MSATGKKSYGRVWDPLVRLFHWVLVGAFATAWFERSEASIHQTAGKVVLVLIILRTAWGLIGPASSRFDTFVKGPVTTLKYVFSIFRGSPAHYLGHNPAGAAMIGALLLSLVTTAASGVLMTTTAFWGGEWIEWVHGTAATLTVFLIAGHLLGVAAACFQHRENLPLSMVTGRKLVSVNTERFLGPTMFTRQRVLTAIAIIAMASAAWAGSNALFNAGVWRMPKTITAEAKKAGCEVEEITGPRIVVYPALQLQYDVNLADSAGAPVAAIPALTALEPRPKIDISNVAAECQTIVRSQFVENLGAPLIKFAELIGSVLPVQSVSRTPADLAGKPETSQAGAAVSEPSQEALTSAAPAPEDAVAGVIATKAAAAAGALKPLATGKLKIRATIRPTPASPVPPKAKAQKKAAKVTEAKVLKAKPPKKVLKKKPVRKIKVSRTVKNSSAAAANGNLVRRQYYDSSERSGSGNSGSGNSGSGSSNSGSENSGSGSSNSGSGNSGSGGDDD